jgi:hypothetical protein
MAISELDAAWRIATARALATDAACAQAVAAWRERDIDSILLKGLSTAEWLYRGEPRGYQDADLLVAPDRVGEAQAVLGELGYVPASEPDSLHAHPWIRSSDGSVIDLHLAVWGANRQPSEVWDELQRWVELQRVGAVQISVLRLPARALHLALHAAQHRDVAGPRRDLRRALARTSRSDWLAAEGLADRIWALPLMALGLQLEPAGREILRELPLARAGLVAELEDAPLAIGFARLAAARGLRAKASVLTGGIARPHVGARLRWLMEGLARTARAMRRAKRTNWELIDRD